MDGFVNEVRKGNSKLYRALNRVVSEAKPTSLEELHKAISNKEGALEVKVALFLRELQRSGGVLVVGGHVEASDGSKNELEAITREHRSAVKEQESMKVLLGWIAEYKQQK